MLDFHATSIRILCIQNINHTKIYIIPHRLHGFELVRWDFFVFFLILFFLLESAGFFLDTFSPAAFFIYSVSGPDPGETNKS